MLSEAGQRLYPYAQRILALHQEARQKVTGKKTPLAGELSLAASSIPGEHLLPRFLQVFRKRNPRIQVRATVADTAAVLSQVERGEVQMGLVGAKRDRPYLEFRPFACDRMALVVPARHALGCRKQVSLQELCEQPLILREAGSGSRWCLEEALSWAGKSATDLRVALELGSNEGIKEAVLRGIGLAVLSTQAVAKELRSGQLRALRVRDLCLKRKMFVVWDRRRVLSIPARLFLDLVELHAAHLS